MSKGLTRLCAQKTSRFGTPTKTNLTSPEVREVSDGTMLTVRWLLDGLVPA